MIQAFGSFVCVCTRGRVQGGGNLRCKVFQSCGHIVHSPAIKVLFQCQPGQQQVALPSSLQSRKVGGLHTKNSCVLCHSFCQETQQLLDTGNPVGGSSEGEQWEGEGRREEVGGGRPLMNT